MARRFRVMRLRFRYAKRRSVIVKQRRVLDAVAKISIIAREPRHALELFVAHFNSVTPNSSS
jgi:hypothetical protein